MFAHLKQNLTRSAGMALLLFCAPVLVSAYTPSPFQESSDLAIGTAINTLRAKQPEEVQVITFSSPSSTIRSFAFPVTWIAKMKSSDGVSPFSATPTHVAKRLHEVILEKGDANVKAGGASPKLIEPVQSYIDDQAPPVENVMLMSKDSQALYLIPLSSPMGADGWKGTAIALITAQPASLDALTMPATELTQEELVRQLTVEKVPSARNVEVQSSTFLGRPAQAVSYLYERIGVTHRVQGRIITMSDGTNVQLIIQAPEALFDKALAAATLMEKQLVIGAPASGSSSSATKESSSSSSASSVKSKQPKTQQQRIERLRELLKKRLEKRKAKVK